MGWIIVIDFLMLKHPYIPKINPSWSWKWKWSRSVVFDSLQPHGHQAPLSMGFSRQEYWSGLPFPSPGNFPTQGSNPGLPHCRQTLYRLSHQGSHAILFFLTNLLMELSIQKCAQMVCVWLNKVSLRKHTNVISTQIKQQNISSTPKAPPRTLSITTMLTHSNHHPGTQTRPRDVLPAF